jgi:chloramphenicol-sensitive protein RarD
MAAPAASGAGGGATFALLAYGSWGLVPLYWNLLKGIPSPEILSHRVLWSTALLLCLVAWKRQATGLRAAFGSRRALGVYLLSATLIGANWFIYVFAVTNGHVLESSLGYFINPLVNVALGVGFLKERLGRAQWLALGLAGAGVVWLVAAAGVFLWIALSLSLTFGFYGLVRKRAPLPSLLGSTLESALLAPLALVWLAWLMYAGNSHFFATPQSPSGTAPIEGGVVFTSVAMLVGGAVTALPLLWFSEAAKRLSLTTLGFFQFVAPTLQFLLAVLVFREPFGASQAVAFGLIWSALAVNVGASLRARIGARVSDTRA